MPGGTRLPAPPKTARPTAHNVQSIQGNLVPGKRTRQLKVYINPHTEECVETKGGNHSTIKKWKAEHGASAVEGWVQK